ncbi:MAG: TonB-dependent receptor, partial [Proteobacteria bacterium]|nr:TonB-dependent receptor [Pseudomonadota bacterium]
IADAILTGRLPVGGGAIEFETDEGIYADRNVGAVAPGAEYPLTTVGTGVASIASGLSYPVVRGAQPASTGYFIDGVRVNDPTNSRGGAFDFGQIDPLALERIEVAKGALSAVHGADALSGAVQLHLRSFEAGERLSSARLTGDTAGGYGASATFGASLGTGSVLASGSRFDSGELTAGSELDGSQAFGRIEQTLGPLNVSALALGAHTDRRLFPEDSGGPRLAVIRELEQRETRLALAGFDIALARHSAWRPALSLNWTRQEDASTTPPIAPGPVLNGVPAINSDSVFRRVEATFDNRFRLGDAAELALGATYLEEQGDSTGSIDFGMLIPADFSIERHVASAFGEVTLTPMPSLVATLGARYDDPSSESGESTGRAAVRLEPFSSGPALLASWSEGYKLPSLFALAYPIIANPKLKPERSSGFDVGVEQRWADDRGAARLSYFDIRYTDLIDFEPELFTNVNRSRVLVSGAELDLRMPLSGVSGVQANLTYLDTEHPRGTLPLRSRPQWQGFVAFDWHTSDRLTWYASLGYTSDFYDSSVPTGLVTLRGRSEVTAAARYRFSDAASLTVSARNLLSQDQEDSVGFPGADTVLRASLVLRR